MRRSMHVRAFALAIALLSAAHASSNHTSKVNQGPKFLGSHASLPKASDPASAAGSDSLSMTSAAMEAAMTDLMLGKSALSATPMGGSVKQIRNLLEKTMMPKVLKAHEHDQKELVRLANEIKKCGKTKKQALGAATGQKSKYRSESKNHKACRADEAVKFTSQKNCLTEQKSLKQIKKGKCDAFSQVIDKLGTQKANRAVVSKAGGESVDSYMQRISTTICGKHVHGSRGQKKAGGGWGGGLEGGYLDQYLRAKDACEKATKAYADKVKECKDKVRAYNTKKGKCDQFQAVMDSASCKSAIISKDACESYAECYRASVNSYKTTRAKVEIEETDRTAEWRGLKRMSCLISAFADGKVHGKEVDACKKKVVDTSHLMIKYPKIPPLEKCEVPQLYPSTGSYKLAEFAPLPDLAKGKESVECSGIQEISTKPFKGSPKGCKCRRVTLNGFYSAGPMVVCTNCKDVRRSRDQNSCPEGTKIFSPASQEDWDTFLSSAKPLRAPHFIVDITSPQNSCGGCKKNAMNSKNLKQKMWITADGSPWWLRSSAYNEPNGDYSANCYLNLNNFDSGSKVTFNDGNCNYHSKSYYCQLFNMGLEPRAGSPKSCKCKKVDLTGKYSPGALVKCEECISVSRSQQKNSCPAGMKLFSPRSRGDWSTFIKSTQPLKAPHFIIDITRPQDGCGGCKNAPMKSSSPKQATWRTSDRSPWWLRSTNYNEPNGNYKANCYLNLWRTPHNSENNIQFDDANCAYHSRSYYCQPEMKKVLKAAAPPPPPPLPSSVRIGSFYYRTLDNVPPGAGYGKAKGTCQKKWLAVPSGWEIAPYERKVLDYPWSTHCLVFNDGKSFGGKAYRPGRNCGKNILKNRGNTYKVGGCSRRIIIRKMKQSAAEVTIGNFFYATLDRVKPTAAYRKDKGLSDPGCHTAAYKRALPDGWELAPYDRKVLDYPWSTHCLIFKDGKSYGSSAYGSGENCGSGVLGKSGNKYWASSCSRRIIIRKRKFNRAKFKSLKRNVQCKSNGVSMGQKGSAQDCADAVKAVGGKFFIYGKGKNARKCWRENTHDKHCEEGYRKDSYDFYELK